MRGKELIQALLAVIVSTASANVGDVRDTILERARLLSVFQSQQTVRPRWDLPEIPRDTRAAKPRRSAMSHQERDLRPAPRATGFCQVDRLTWVRPSQSQPRSTARIGTMTA